MKKQSNFEKIMNDENYFTQIISNLKVEYLCDISFAYQYKTENIDILFYQNENAVNIVEQFCKKVKNYWIIIYPTDFQVKIMFDKLNSTEFRKIETFTPMPWEYEMHENGHSFKDFY